MKAKDLMIGDWVNIAIEEYNNPTRIKEIGSFWVKVIKDEMEYGNILVTPIPLTTEILKKNGFVKQWNGSWRLNDYNSIIISENFYIAIFELSVRLDYIHELQHLFKLCGIDKEIEL